jgi:hypothetical protein
MRIKLGWMLGLLAAANGVFMLAAPAAWYAMAPGVPNTGSLNAHFIRDIGAAFLVAGGSLGYGDGSTPSKRSMITTPVTCALLERPRR